VLDYQPNHAKVLQQLAWITHMESSSLVNQERAIELLEKSVAAGTLSPEQDFSFG
jgi:hypothetical protein